MDLSLGPRDPPGPVRAALAGMKRDGLTLPTGTVIGLTGNVAEWARDSWQELRKSCWPDEVLFDPICTARDVESRHVVRGADWASSGIMLLSSMRTAYPTIKDISIGFRCARSATQ